MSKELEQRVLDQTRELAAANEALRKETIERRRAEEALRLSEEQFRGAFDHAPIGMALIHPDGRWFRVNHVFCRMLGYSEQELIGANFQSTTHPDDIQPTLEGFQRLLSGERDSFTLEKRFFHKEGRTVWANVSATLVRRAGENPPYFVKQIQDITERKRAETERDRHAAQLQGLADASLAMNSALSLDETLKIVTEKSREIIGAHMSVTRMPVNENWEQAISIVSLSDKYSTFRKFDGRPDGLGIYSIVCQSNRPMRMTQAELEAHPKWRGYGPHAGGHPPLRGWLAAPLVGRDGRNIGLIQLSDKEEGEFTQQDEAILVQMAQMASVAIENARLYEALEEDLAKQKRTEERLREYEKAVEGLEEMIVVVDRDYRYLLANRAFLNYRGFTKEQLVGRLVPEVLNPGVFEEVAKKKLDECLQGNVVKYELKYRYPKLGERDLSISYFPVEGSAGIDRVACILQDITERKRAEEALRTSEERFRRYFELGLVGMAMTAPSKGFIEVNDQLCKILGYERGELLQKTWVEVTCPDDLASDVALFNRVVAGEMDGYSIDKRFIHKDGRVIHGTMSVKCLRRGDGSIDYFVALLQDVTERKQAEARLVYQANLLTHVGDAILATDDQLILTAWNLAAEKIYGWKAEEVLGQKMYDAVRSELTDVQRSEALQAISEKGYYHADLVHTRKNGTRIHIQGYTIALRDESGRITGYVSANRDVTERKRAEEALRAEHAFRKAIEEAMPAGVMAVDATGRQTYVNQSFCKMVGWSAEELNGATPPFIFWPPEQIDLICHIFENHMHGMIKPGPVELIFRRRNEERFPVSLLVSPLVDPRGVPVGYLASVHDITLLKTSQEKLARRERQLSQAQRLAQLGSWSWDLLTDTVTWSDEFYRICGVDPERFVSTYQSLLHLIHPHDREKVEQATDKALRERTSFDLFYRIIGMDGIVRTHHASGMVSVDPLGRPLSVVGVAQDITEIKKAEDTLRESEERYRSLIANIPDAAWRVREDGEPVFISQNIEQILGYDAKEIYSDPLRLTFGRIHPDDRDRVAKAFKSLFSKNKKFDVEYRVQTKNGGWIWIHNRAVMTYRKDGVRYADGVVSDITERKKSEEAIRKSEERFHLIARATNDVIWDWDLVANNLWWNESFKTIFGYRVDEIEPGIESWTSRIHPEDKERVLRDTHAVIERGGRFWSAEYRFRRADGSYATILDRGYVVHVQDGKPVRMIGAMIDITERKRAEDALTEYAKRLRSLSGQLLEAQETERRRIARELHDEIGQSLTAIKLQLHGSKRLSDRRMEECIQMVDQALSQVRNLSLALHPPELDELGLVATLRWHLDRQAHAANLISNFSADPLPARLPPDLEIACFRVAQEALTNVIRHAHASEVSIELRQRESELHLTVEDDGEGFDVGAARSRAIQGTSLGLVGMQERAELAGGRLELDSAPGEGTQVRAIFQLADTAPKKQSKRRKR